MRASVSTQQTGQVMTRLQRESPVALYRQIAIDLAATLTTQYEVGQRLPSENELMTSYGVSRITIRQALTALATQGLIVRQQGKGTFVAPTHLRQDQPPPTGFVDMLTAQGLEPETMLLSFGPRQISGSVARRLQLEQGEALGFRRLYRLAGRPLALTEVYYPPAIGVTITRAAAEAHSSQLLLTKFAGVILGHADLQIRAATIAADLAAALAVDPGLPVLIEDRLSYCTAGLPREHSTLYLHPNFCELHLTLQAGQPLAHAIHPLNSGRTSDAV